MFNRFFGAPCGPPTSPTCEERIAWLQEQVIGLERQLYQKQNMSLYTKDGHSINLEALIFELARKADVSIRVEDNGYSTAMPGFLGQCPPPMR